MKICLFANTDWFLYNFRLAFARELCSLGYEVVLISPRGAYGDKMVGQGFRWIPFEVSQHGKNLFKETQTLWRLIRLYQREKPDIVHHFTIKCVLYGSIAARTARIVGVVNTITGLGFVFINQSPTARFLRWMVKYLYRFALKRTQVIFQNREDAALFLDMKLASREQSHLIPGDGIDMLAYQPSATQMLNLPLVILPARMLWAKGIREFVEAAHRLVEQGVHARFILVGDTDSGNPDAVPASQLKDWTESGWVEWWGWQEDMPAVYHLSSIVCLPSYREGTPKSLIEAAACGLPIVATDVPGCREIVQHQRNGLLVPPRDVPALAEALESLIRDPELRMKMGKHSREIAEHEYALDEVVNRTLVVYQISVK